MHILSLNIKYNHLLFHWFYIDLAPQFPKCCSEIMGNLVMGIHCYSVLTANG